MANSQDTNERLAQPEPEPVCDKDPQGCWNVRCQLGKVCKNTSPRRRWVGLTEEEMVDLQDRCGISIHQSDFEAIEAKLREKNT